MTRRWDGGFVRGDGLRRTRLRLLEARALVPGGHLLLGTHVGDGDVVRTEAYGGVPVAWTTYLWQPEELSTLLTEAGFQVGPRAEVARLTSEPAPGATQRPQTELTTRRAMVDS